MKQESCLNCNAETTNHFCSNCGQKTDTHRITLKHFLLHDMMHGIWHLEKGILFTIKETFVRPGQAALDYIHGKRIRYYNVFYLAILIIGLGLLLGHLYESMHPIKEDTANDTIEVTLFFKNNLKIILLSIVPILGIVAFLIFKRLQLNLAEHFIMSGISLLGMLIINVVLSLFDFLEGGFDFFGWSVTIQITIFISMLLFPVWTYYNATKNLYTFFGFLWRIVVFYVCVLSILSLIVTIIVYTLTNGKTQFYINMNFK
ncbi:DUF3667 domain-containing protein [Flavobacterium sp.]|uniref:DUF3667 domain-containing protein n=1 Tax=Flavobacterium sp. TaxID=239 RepID=UPI00286C028A|nr:DUF3667 domain-containing protein [Flavobacterium sp.]